MSTRCNAKIKDAGHDPTAAVRHASGTVPSRRKLARVMAAQANRGMMPTFSTARMKSESRPRV